MSRFSASWDNRALAASARRCGCYYCLRTYKPALIKEWTDDGKTAICPFCGIDSVIPSAKARHLRELKREGFGKWSICFRLGSNSWARGITGKPMYTRKQYQMARHGLEA